jgi:hypothetical protein
MFRKVAIVAGVSAALSSAAQADYQWELNGAYVTGDIEEGSFEADQDLFVAAGAVFFEPVDTSKGPLAEAAFLDRASGIAVDFENGEIEGSRGVKADIEGYGIQGRFINKYSGLIFDVGYRQDETETSVAYAGGDWKETWETDTFSIGLGGYVADNTSLLFSYGNIDTGGSEADTYSADVEHLINLGQGAALKLDGGYTYVDPQSRFGDDGNNISLGGTWYVTRWLGFGVDYERADFDELETDGWTLSAEWFVNEQIAVTLAYTDVESTYDEGTYFESQQTSDTVLLGVRARF